jgi:hypothetical protein
MIFQYLLRAYCVIRLLSELFEIICEPIAGFSLNGFG